MADRLIHRTWSIRTISSFTVPLSFDDVDNSKNSSTNDEEGTKSCLWDSTCRSNLSLNGTASSSMSSSALSYAAPQRRYSTLYDLEDDITSFLQRDCCHLRPHDTNCCKDDDDDDEGGTYVSLAWIILNDENCRGETDVVASELMENNVVAGRAGRRGAKENDVAAAVVAKDSEGTIKVNRSDATISTRDWEKRESSSTTAATTTDATTSKSRKRSRTNEQIPYVSSKNKNNQPIGNYDGGGEERQKNNGELSTSTSVRNNKSQHSNSTASSVNATNKERGVGFSRHLHIDVRVNDEPAAQILLCFAHDLRDVDSEQHQQQPTCMETSECGTKMRKNSGDGNGNGSDDGDCGFRMGMIILSFSYILVRGSNKVFTAVLQWFESELGCVVGNKPYQPSPCDVAHALASWTILSVEQRKIHHHFANKDKLHHTRGDGGVVDDDGGGGSMVTSLVEKEHRRQLNTPNDKSDGNINVNDDLSSSLLLTPSSTTIPISDTRPLEITFAISPMVLSHTSSSPTTLPGLERITITVPPVALRRLSVAIMREGNKLRESTTATTTTTTSNNHHPTILKALQCFIHETFHMNMQAFDVVRVSNGIAVFGCDGRCKPLDRSKLFSVLREIESIVLRAHGFC